MYNLAVFMKTVVLLRSGDYVIIKI